MGRVHGEKAKKMHEFLNSKCGEDNEIASCTCKDGSIMEFPVEKPCGRDNKPETCVCADGAELNLAEIFKGKRPGKKDKKDRKDKKEKDGDDDEDAEKEEEKDEAVAEKEEDGEEKEKKMCKDGSEPKCVGRRRKICFCKGEGIVSGKPRGKGKG